jgi:hypothetical protein
MEPVSKQKSVYKYIAIFGPASAGPFFALRSTIPRAFEAGSRRQPSSSASFGIGVLAPNDQAAMPKAKQKTVLADGARLFGSHPRVARPVPCMA